MSEIPKAVRAYMGDIGRKGGKAGTGEAKRRVVRSREFYQEAAAARWKRAQVRARAQEELLEAAREIGAFLDSVKFSNKAREILRRELLQRLYAAVVKVKGVAA